MYSKWLFFVDSLFFFFNILLSLSFGPFVEEKTKQWKDDTNKETRGHNYLIIQMLRGSPSRNWRPSEAVGRHLLQSIENGDSVKGEQGGERDIRAAGQGRRPGLWGRSLQGRHLSF